MSKAARVRRNRKIRRRQRAGTPVNHKGLSGRTGKMHHKKNATEGPPAMTDSKAIRVIEALQLFATISCIGIGAGVLIHLVGEFVIFTYLLPEAFK